MTKPAKTKKAAYQLPPLPADWQVVFDLWREEAAAPIVKQVDALMSRGENPLFSVMGSAMEPQLFEQMALVRREQIFEAALWCLLATVPKAQAEHIVVTPRDLNGANWRRTINVVWKDAATKEEQKRVDNIIRYWTRHFPSKAEQRAPVGTYRLPKAWSYDYKAPKYPLGASIEELLPQLCTDLSRDGEGLKRRYEAWQLRQAMSGAAGDSSMEAVAETPGARRRRL